MATVSFSKTPQAVDDLYNYLENQLGLLTSGTQVILDVMSNDLGGKAKAMFSVDDGSGNPLNPTDLLTADGLVNGVSAWEATANGNLVRINNGKLELNLGNSIAGIGGTNINSLAAGDHIHDSFVYAIRLGNGTLSWAHVTFDLYGENDAATISGQTSGALSEDATLPVTGTLTVIDPDHGQSHTQAVSNGASVAGLGTYSVDADGHWSYAVKNAAVQYLAAGETATDSFVVTSLDGTAQQTVTVTINGIDGPVPVLPLSSLDGSSGFRIDGVASNDLSGNWVASAGDVNGDGFADLIVGAETLNDHSSTTSYVIFGNATGFASHFELSSLDGTNGFRLSNAPEGSRGGECVASAGDVNGDGFGDLIIGALGADPNGEASGASYVVLAMPAALPPILTC